MPYYATACVIYVITFCYCSKSSLSTDSWVVNCPFKKPISEVSICTTVFVSELFPVNTCLNFSLV